MSALEVGLSTNPADAAAPRIKALVVDDEPDLVRVVSAYLEQEGFEVAAASDGAAAVAAVRDFAPDVVVLDVVMPVLDGIEACRQIRTFSDAYIVMLTARSEEVDTLIGLAAGADDYVTKPFSPRVLVARIKTLLRRPRSGAVSGVADEPVRVFGDLTIDPTPREVWLRGELIALTRTEYDLLDVLSERPRQAFTRAQLIERVWGAGWVGDEHMVDVHLGHVRAKLADNAAEPRYVLTVRGVGYRMGTG